MVGTQVRQGLCGLAVGGRDAIGVSSRHHGHGNRDGHRRRQAQARRQKRAGQGRVPPGPAPAAAQGADRPGADRLAADEAGQVVGQLLSTRITLARELLQALEADGFQVARHVQIEPNRRHRFLEQDLLQRCESRVGLEGRPPGQALVEDRPQGVYVGGRTDHAGVSLGLLGSHVTRGAAHVALARRRTGNRSGGPGRSRSPLARPWSTGGRYPA